VNSLNAGWKAVENGKFSGINRDEAKSMMGTIVDPELLSSQQKIRWHGNITLSDEVANAFDARTQWPKCKVISTIRDQAHCGSCWAHGTTEAFNDRDCIKDHDGKGPDLPLFSVADTTGCCKGFSCGFSAGCNGGQIDSPWDWFTRTGVVSGGNYGDKTTCYPYTMPECAHHVSSPTLKNCDDTPQVDPKCTKTCEDSEN